MAGLLVVGCRETMPTRRLVSEAHREGAIRVVTTEKGARDAAPVWEVVPDLRIGEGTDSADFDAVWDIALWKNGQIAVLLTRQSQIRVFNHDGKFVRTIGRAGSGPGEFRAATKMAVDAAGRMWVSDAGRKVYMAFDSTGKLLKEYPRPTGFDCRPVPCGLLVSSNGTRVDGRIRPVAPSVFRTEMFLADSLGHITDSLPLPLADSAPGNAGRGPTPFGRRLLTAPASDRAVWMGFSSAYAFVLLTIRGDTTLHLKGFADPVEPADADRASYSERVKQLGSAIGPTSTDQPVLPSVKPPISQIAVADDGALWVALAGKIDGVAEWFDVYNPDGTIRARAHLTFEATANAQSAPPMNPSPIVIRGNYIYLVTRDENDIPSVVRARIKR